MSGNPVSYFGTLVLVQRAFQINDLLKKVKKPVK